MKMKFEKIIEFTPAYDKRHPDPKKNYGIGCVKIRFVLKGEKGAVQFLMGTGWFLPEIVKEYKGVGRDLTVDYPKGWDLGYHSPKPMYKGHKPITKKCSVLGGKCYYDGSTSNAEPIFDVLIKEGSDGVWRELEKYYYSVFGED